MAVWTKHSEILETVVVILAIAVIELHRERAAPTIGQAALVANIPEYARFDQTPFDRISASRIP